MGKPHHRLTHRQLEVLLVYLHHPKASFGTVNKWLGYPDKRIAHTRTVALRRRGFLVRVPTKKNRNYLRLSESGRAVAIWVMNRLDIKYPKTISEKTREVCKQAQRELTKTKGLLEDVLALKCGNDKLKCHERALRVSYMLMERTQILARGELEYLAQRWRYGKSTLTQKGNFAIFRLSCMGLLGCEIAGLTMDDFIGLGTARPTIRIRKENTKGTRAVWKYNPDGRDTRRARSVPLWWDGDVLYDIETWHALRKEIPGTTGKSPFICSTHKHNYGARIVQTASGLRARWKTCIKVLGPKRTAELSLYSGRHTFIAYALVAGHSAEAVRQAVGYHRIEPILAYLPYVEEIKAEEPRPLYGGTIARVRPPTDELDRFDMTLV